VSTQVITPLLTGAFGLAGVLGGVLLTSHLTRRADEQRMSGEDARRWLIDRRKVYAEYLGIIFSMLREMDGLACFLPNEEEEEISEENEAYLKDNLFEYYMRWDDKLQPALEEIQLLAKPQVAELADRTSWALIELGGFVESRQPCSLIYPYINQTRRLIDITRNAMRAELGVVDPVNTFPMPRDWPWLPDEPPAPEVT
jgi:hypothetical protein